MRKETRRMTATPDSRVRMLHQKTPSLPNGFHVQNGRLYHQGIDLMAFIQRPVNNHGQIETPTMPLYIRRLPALRDNYNALGHWFEVAKEETGFPGELTIAYASKANPSEPVARTLLQMGAAHEGSSIFDVDVIRHAAAAGWLDRERTIFANGFKIPAYVDNLLRLRSEGFSQLLPIFDDLDELETFAQSGLVFEVGLRSRTASRELNRFGMTTQDMETAAWRVEDADTPALTTFPATPTISMTRPHPDQDPPTESQH